MAEGSSNRRPSIGALMPIKALATYNTRWKVQGRVMEKGSLTTFARKGGQGGGEGKVFTSVIMDKEGTQINVKFWNQLADLWYEKLEKGQVYNFSKGRIAVSNKRYAGTVDHDYEMIFEREAEITPVATAEEIPVERKVQYQSLRSVNLSTKTMPFMVNLLTVVHTWQQVRETVTKLSSEQRKRRVVTVVDATCFALDVTLWANHAEVADALLEEHPVVAFHNLQIREWRGRAGATANSTDIQWDVKTPAAKELKQWYDANAQTAVFEPLSGIAGDGAGVARPAREVTLAELEAAVSELPTDEPGMFKVTAFITSLMYRNVRENLINAIYLACPRCNRKVTENGICGNCSETVTPAPRLHFSAVLADSSASGFAVRVFNECGQRLIGLSANKALAMQEEANSNPTADVPAEFNEAFENACIWRRYVFTLRGRRENYQGELRTNYQVMTAMPATKGLLGAAAMQQCLKYVPNAFDGVQHNKRVCLEPEKGADFPEENDGGSIKRQKVVDDELPAATFA